MRKTCRRWACVLVAVGSLTVAWRGQAEETPERIAWLIKQLDADAFEEREQATAELGAIGEPAQAALEKAGRESKSAEVRTRAAGLLKALALARTRKNPLKLTDFFAEAKRASEGQPNAERLDALVARLIEILARESDRNDLRPPVLANDLNAGESKGLISNALLAQKCGRIAMAENSVVLFGTAGAVGNAKNCIVIAPLAIEVSVAENCIVLGGSTTQVNIARGSIVLSSGQLFGSVGDNSFLGAGGEVRVRGLRKAMVIGARAVELPGVIGPDDSTTLQVPALDLRQQLTFDDPLRDKLEITYLGGSSTSGFLLFKLPDGSGEYVARAGQEIRSPQGQPLAGLEGWKLSFCSGRIAVFEKGDEVSVMRLGR